jgi:hypothetical protein
MFRQLRQANGLTQRMLKQQNQGLKNGWIQRMLEHLSQLQVDNGMLQKLSLKHSSREKNGLLRRTLRDRKLNLQLESLFSMLNIQTMLKELMLFLLSTLLQLQDGKLLLSPMSSNSM